VALGTERIFDAGAEQSQSDFLQDNANSVIEEQAVFSDEEYGFW
jgi:hypothetical protein